MKLISVSIDNKELVERGVIEIRRAPGHCHFDFGQRIPLMKPTESKVLSVNDNLCTALSLLSPRSEYIIICRILFTRTTNYPHLIFLKKKKKILSNIGIRYLKKKKKIVFVSYDLYHILILCRILILIVLIIF